MVTPREGAWGEVNYREEIMVILQWMPGAGKRAFLGAGSMKRSAKEFHFRLVH